MRMFETDPYFLKPSVLSFKFYLCELCVRRITLGRMWSRKGGQAEVANHIVEQLYNVQEG